MFKHVAIAAAAVALVCGTSYAALAADHQVKMLNKGPDGKMMEFDPAFLQIAPGDTVTFVPTDKGHSSDSINGMIPDGVQPWKGGMSQEITVTFTKPGVYAYKCMPHFTLGMVGLIEVGSNPPNLDAAKGVRLPPLADKKMKELFAQVK
ncbi:MAG: pseudoazurin [Rhizobiaceae bacterium]|jgi:pseudoazurin|nr:MAG: pseudoazurin [Rhizobiaceae bacterium]